MMKHLFLLFFPVLLPLALQAQGPVFKPENCRPVLDGLTYQNDAKNMDSGEMDENTDRVVAFMRKTLAADGKSFDGFTVSSDTIVTKTIHLHFEVEEVDEEAFDMYVHGRWLVDIEWPSADLDPYLIMRRWIANTIREQLESTYNGEEHIVPFPGGSAEYRPMLDYYAGKYRKYYKERMLAQNATGEWEGAYAYLYKVEFNPVLFIRVRCINPKYVTFYVADIRPGYRSTPSYYQQTLNRYNGKPVWLEDLVTEERIQYIKEAIRAKYAPFEVDGNLDDVIKNHNYCLALTESGITLSFLPYTFSITAGSEAFQYSVPYKEVIL